MKLTTCRECSAPIWFGKTAKGHRMPIDERPATEKANVVIDADLFTPADADEPQVRVVEPGTGTYVSHFATCPSAERFRKRGRR